MKPHSRGKYPNLSGVKKVLVICLRHIGDVVLTSPVFGALKGGIEDVTVDALVNSGTEDVLTGNPDINKVLVLNRTALKDGIFSRIREELRLLKEVRSEAYDMVIVLSTGDRGVNISFLSGAKVRVGAEPKKKGTWRIVPSLTIPVSMAPAGRHTVERNLDILRKIGIFPDWEARHTLFFIDKESSTRIERQLAKAGVSGRTPYMVVHPTSRWMFKCWPYEKVAELIDLIQGELKIPVVLTSGPDEQERAYIRDLVGAIDTKVIDLSGILSLKELGAVIRGARLFFGIDSAPMHISAALKTPVVVLFGPSSAVDWGPWPPRGEGHRIITSTRHDCIPCGRDGCDGSKVSDCLVEISVEAVFQAVKEQLQSPPGVDIIYLGRKLDRRKLDTRISEYKSRLPLTKDNTYKNKED